MKRLMTGFFVVLLALSGCARGPAPDPEQVTARYISAPLPFEDPGSRLWNQAAEHPAQLAVQNIAEPKLLEPGVELVRVRALHNGAWVVFRLEWSDSTQDLIPRTGSSSDAAAIQFPLAGEDDVPYSAMGEAGKGVRIWYWKAVWQDDAARANAGKPDRVASLYPNATIDHYPYEATTSERAEMEKRYAPARAAENPILVRLQESPVQVLVAEGFGNTHPAPVQAGRARGEWVRGNWQVTIARPLNGGEPLGQLAPGERSYIALAVWDGAEGHSGSRKMRSEWIPLVLERK